MGLFQLIFALVVIAGGCLLFSHSSRLRALLHSNEPVVLEKALDTLRVFWIYTGILLIIFLAFAIFWGVWAVAIGGTFPSFDSMSSTPHDFPWT